MTAAPGGRPQETGIMGFEPDRMLELGTGQLAVLTHVMRPESQEFAEILSLSDDGGKTWRAGGGGGARRLPPLLRRGAGVPGRRSRRRRRARAASWPACCARTIPPVSPALSPSRATTARPGAPPQMCPFALHRPYAKRLADGRVLVTGRHVNGGLGTYAWCGDLRAEAGTYQVGGPRRKFAAELTGDALRIDNRPDHECRYQPVAAGGRPQRDLVRGRGEGGRQPSRPRSCRSRGCVPTGGRWCCTLAGDHLSLADRRPAAVDFSRFRTVRISHRRGLLEVRVDGEVVRSASGVPRRSGAERVHARRSAVCTHHVRTARRHRAPVGGGGCATRPAIRG